MKPINVQTLSSANKLASPYLVVSELDNTPAMSFMTDFKAANPHVIEHATRALWVKKQMQVDNDEVKVVVNHHGDFLGLIGDDELSETCMLKKIAAGFARKEIDVGDLMVPRHELFAITMEDVEHASASEILSVMIQRHQNYCLVTENDSTEVRGMFTAASLTKWVDSHH